MMAATPNKSGGYDYNFVKEPPDTTICVICQLPSRDPYLSVCCGHVFCKSCLDNAKKAAAVVAANCPMCRSEEYMTVPNKQIDRVVRSLHVYCTNKEKGCKWQGEMNYISGHLDGCDFEDVQCSNKCEEIVQRQYLVSHMEANCPRRMVTCQYCGVDGEHQLIEGEHKELCPKFPLPCPNRCDVGSVPRQDMTEHRKMCPLEEVECFNKCGKILQRQYLDSHLETKCPRRLGNCQYCQLTGEHQFIEDQHKEQCPKFPLPCPNNCDSELKVRREDMDTHRKECPLETVQCQYQCVGCDDVMVRKHQRDHNKENMEEHLALAVSELVTLHQRLQRDVTSVKAELTQNLTKVEHELALTQQELTTTKLDAQQKMIDLQKELTTTKHRSSTAYSECLVTEIKYKLPSINEEVTKILTSLQGNIDSVNQECQLVEDTRRKHEQKVNSVDEYTSQSVSKLQEIRNRRTIVFNTTFVRRKQQMSQQLSHRVGGIKQDIENGQGQLLQNITQVEGELPAGIHQQLNDVELHIKSIDELIIQLDTLMKELTIYRENSVVEKLETVKIDTLKSKDEMMKKLTQKREDVTEVKKRLETAKAYTNTRDLLQQLSDKYDHAKRRIEEVQWNM